MSVMWVHHPDLDITLPEAEVAYQIRVIPSVPLRVYAGQPGLVLTPGSSHACMALRST